MEIFTGSYDACKKGNLISISGDLGKRASFTGKSIKEFAPKRKFWDVWHNNIGKISEEDNTRYYIEEYYKQVLSKIDVMELLKYEQKPVLLCYEKSSEFCHRHVLAEYINIVYGIEVKEVEIDEKFNIIEKYRPQNIRKILQSII